MMPLGTPSKYGAAQGGELLRKLVICLPKYEEKKQFACNGMGFRYFATSVKVCEHVLLALIPMGNLFKMVSFV